MDKIVKFYKKIEQAIEKSFIFAARFLIILLLTHIIN